MMYWPRGANFQSLRACARGGRRRGSGVAYSASNGVWPSFYGEMFSTQVRLSGMAIGTQIGFAMGGFAPVIAAAVQGEGPNA